LRKAKNSKVKAQNSKPWLMTEFFKKANHSEFRQVRNIRLEMRQPAGSETGADTQRVLDEASRGGASQL
jgi:hypothetical protein